MAMEDYVRIMPGGYASREPYPEIKPAKRSKMAVDLLLEDYSGNVSELTATLQYMYHNFVEKPANENLANLLEKTAIVEMIHMEVLADAIIALGGKPIYKTGDYFNPKYWSSDLVVYGKNLEDRLKSDLDSEYKAIRKYREHISRIDDPNIQALLKRIILDEEVHVALFKDALKKYAT
jgi:bacterioferritin